MFSRASPTPNKKSDRLRDGGWQTGIGANLRSKSLGVVELGNIGKEVARIGIAFGIIVIARRENLTGEIAHAAGAQLGGKQTLFRRSDIVTIHLVLSRRTFGLVGAAEVDLMKPPGRADLGIIWRAQAAGGS